MSPIEPFINLLIILTILSVAAERISNIVKFRNEKLRYRIEDPQEEREREGAIQIRTVAIGIVISVLSKADMFAFLTHLDDPWSTIGWVRVVGAQWFQSPALQSTGATLYSLGGCILTGFALGFGSKFWHDILSTVNELRNLARNHGSDTVISAGVSEPSGSISNGGDNE